MLRESDSVPLKSLTQSAVRSQGAEPRGRRKETAEGRERMSELLPTGVFTIPVKVSWHRPIGAPLSDQDQLVAQLVC